MFGPMGAASAPFCLLPSLQHCGPLQGGWTQRAEWGSLPINIWGTLDVAAVYLTEHAPGLPWIVNHRGADSTAPSLIPLALHLSTPPLMGAVLLYLLLLPQSSVSPPTASSITIPLRCFLPVNLCTDCHYFSSLLLPDTSTHRLHPLNDLVVFCLL